MGIVNVTPDSFSDGGRFVSTRTALQHCEQLVREGAAILDIGGESTRPGIPPVSLEEERARVLPVVRAAVKFGVPLSVDTYKPELMQEVLDLGADIINDVWALRQPGALDVVAAHAACGVCLMHMHGEPQTMQRTPMEGDAVPRVRDFLNERSEALRQRGVSVSRIAWDPGIGFGKTVDQNFALLARQQELLRDGYPLLAGWSRKSSLGAVTGAAVHERVAASVARRCSPWTRARDRARARREGRWRRSRCGAPRRRAAAGREPDMSRRYFGTDGIRGTVGEPPITPDFVLRLAHAVGRVLKRTEERPTVLIGKDTRISGYMLESALESGFNSAGVDVVLLGPLPTPGVAYLTRAQRASLGVVISASHNPYPDNGIKFFSAQGTKLPDRWESEVEAVLEQPPHWADSATSARRGASTTPPAATSSSARAPSRTTSP